MAGSNELAVQNRIRLALSRGPVRLFRNNTGALKDANGRLVRFGLCQGSSDLIGWKTVTVTPDMVGLNLALFVAIEVKDKGQATQDQQRFLDAVSSAGGLSGIARDTKQAQRILELQQSVKQEADATGSS